MICFKQLLERELSDINAMLDLSAMNDHEMIHLSRKRRHERYYYYRISNTEGKRNYRYIGTNDSEKVRSAKRLIYNSTLSKVLLSDKALLENLLNSYKPYDHISILDKLPATFRDIPFDPFADGKLRELFKWAKGGEPNPVPFNGAFNLTCDGSRVRSKGECIIYNMLFAARIPFRSDKAFEIETEFGSKTVYPDFLIKCINGSYIIIEHLGLMDNADYARRFSEKCRDYVHAGFVIGDNCIFTSDDLAHGINSRAIADQVRIIEQKFYSSAR